MKIFSRIYVLILMVLLMTTGVCYGLSPSEINYNKGLEYAVEGDFEKARREFEKAAKADHFKYNAILGLKVINDVIDNKIKKGTALHLFKGLAYSSRGMLDEAIEKYDKAMTINPKYADAYNVRGIDYGRKGQYGQAIIDFNEAIKINPKLGQAYYNRGFAYTNKGQHEKAIADYSKAIEINPMFIDAYNNRGAEYKDIGQYDNALKDYNKAIEIHPLFAAAFLSRGVLYYDSKQYHHALDDYSVALRINPMLVQIYYLRGITYYYTEKYVKAFEDVQRARSFGIQVDPGFLKTLRKAWEEMKNKPANPETTS